MAEGDGFSAESNAADRPAAVVGAGRVGARWWRRGAAVALAGAAMLCAYGYGVISHRYELFPYHYAVWLARGVTLDRLTSRGGFDVSVNRRSTTCAEIGPRTLVLVTFGQSNAANSGPARFGGSPGIYNFNPFDGRCFEAQDPLLGAGGDGGSVWLPLARQIIESGLAANVVIAPIALGGTRVADWAPGGRLSGRFARMQEAAMGAGLRANAILWHQGESDRDSRAADYRASFLAMVRAIRDSGSTAPIYVARATRCGSLVSREINEVQRELGHGHAELGLREGPDTDTLAQPVWRDGCHFTRAGIVRHAGLWFGILAQDIPGLLEQSMH
jgi:hypothetical protein